MAILQISRITNRKGVTENLPQLAGAELGWCVDSRRLFIGNGTLQEGAPVVGNTELLTEFSDIVDLSNYTYEDITVGYAAQTGPTLNQPVIRSLQAKLDDMASVRDFGAIGDGVADDTAAINRALFQLYCRANNTQIRRSLFFPAGTYKVTGQIIIPSYAKLLGEGRNSSIIRLVTPNDSSIEPCVARTGDSRQQIGINIGNNGATPPTDIEISGLGFQSDQSTDVFIVEAAKGCWFQNVSFTGPLGINQIDDPGVTDLSGITYKTIAGIVNQDIVFDACLFTNTNFAHRVQEATRAVTISNSMFNILTNAVVISTAASGFRIVHNIFDNIYAEALAIESDLNVSAYNMYYNVGYEISASQPTTSVIEFGTSNNISVGDLFERSDSDSLIRPRISFVSNTSSSGGTQSSIGRFAQTAGQQFLMLDNQATAQPIFTVNTLEVQSMAVQYQIVRSDFIRHGVFTVSSLLPVPGSETEAFYSDEFTVPPGLDMGVTLLATQAGNLLTVKYLTSDVSFDATFKYTVTYLS